MLDAALDGAADTVDAVVLLTGRQAVEGNLVGDTLLLQEVVVPVPS